jgi:uncharacterized coiled-coil DUF342 family protein
MTDAELKQLVKSNARAIQAMPDARAEERQQHQEFRERTEVGIARLENIVERLTNLQEGMSNLLVSVNEDRPTILRKLTSIENKVNQLLEQRGEGA